MFRKQIIVALGMGAAIAVLLIAWAMLPSLPLPRSFGNER
jgi:hypothetical protein